MPTYRLAALVKTVTGLVSIATAAVLYKSIPDLLAIPSNAQLEVANQKLKGEVQSQVNKGTTFLVFFSKNRIATLVET